LTNIYDILRAIFERLRIKNRDDMDEQDVWDKRMREHQKRYTRAEAQAADPFHARYYPEQFARLEAQLDRHPDLLPIDRQGIHTNARLAIGFMPTEVDDYSGKGNTRFYGLPDLPPGMEYPRYDPKAKRSSPQKGELCKFFAQINFAEIKGMQDYLPDSGILYLFIDSSVVSNIACGGVLEPRMVCYYQGDVDALQSAKDLDIQPGHIYDVACGYEREDGAQPARVKIFPYVNILDTYDEERDAMDYPPKLYDASASAINEALMAEAGLKACHSINSHVPEVYNEYMEVNGEYVTSPYVEAAQALGGRPEDYVVLLRLGWDFEVSGFMFGDAGHAYFMMAKNRLKRRDFSQIYYNATSY